MHFLHPVAQPSSDLGCRAGRYLTLGRALELDGKEEEATRAWHRALVLPCQQAPRDPLHLDSMEGRSNSASDGRNTRITLKCIANCLEHP